MAIIMSNIPAVAMADSQMIPTSVVVDGMNRAQTERNIQDFLNRTDVREQLTKQGLSADEVSQRLANLNESEMRQLSGQIEKAQAGGDILIAILVVVLIIFLIKRI